ncbi:MAG: hypothetical protein DCE90_00800 [Pseudanabaena sp.]|nr:MAG: hypothetical protein DCE90_00800 [Pseudanabaena sp.]
MLFFFLTTLLSFNPTLSSPPFVLAQSSDSVTDVNYGYEPTSNLANDLRKGGYVIFFRHTTTDRTQKDLNLNFENCANQRNLNQKGREEAQAIGIAFKRLKIPVGTVLASPFCRTLETAQIAFGKSTRSEDLISIAHERKKSLELAQSLTKLIKTMPSDATNTILVGHGVNLDIALELNLKEGGAAIFKPKTNRSFALVAQIQDVKEWEEVSLSHLLEKK